MAMICLFTCALRNFLRVAPLIESMRRISFLALMLLLVLRGLLGTAMAAGMVPSMPTDVPVPQATVAPHGHASHAPDHSLIELAGLAAHAEHSVAPNAQCPDPATGHCDTASHTHSPLCSACEICHSALLVPSPLSAPLRSAASEVRPGATAPFASAQPALAIKPPIA